MRICACVHGRVKMYAEVSTAKGRGLVLQLTCGLSASSFFNDNFVIITLLSSLQLDEYLRVVFFPFWCTLHERCHGSCKDPCCVIVTSQQGRIRLYSVEGLLVTLFRKSKQGALLAQSRAVCPSRGVYPQLSEGGLWELSEGFSSAFLPVIRLSPGCNLNFTTTLEVQVEYQGFEQQSSL